jgi:hypothetical protein
MWCARTVCKPLLTIRAENHRTAHGVPRICMNLMCGTRAKKNPRQSAGFS